MTIIYTVITRAVDATILVEVADSDIKGGNLRQMFLRMFEYFRDNPSSQFQNEEMKTYIQRNNNSTGSSDYYDPMDFLSYFVDSCTSVLNDDNNNNSNNNNDKSTTETTDGLEYELSEEYFIHVYYKDGIFYTCLADDPEIRDQKVSFAYLQTIQKDFVKFFRAGRIKKSRPYGLDKDFTPVVRSIVHYHNINHNRIRTEDRVQFLETKINNLKDILQYNLHLLIKRSHDLERMITKSDQLEDQVQVFKKRTKANVRIQQRIYYSQYLILCSVILLCLYVGLAIPCGFMFQRCQLVMKAQDSTGNNNGSSSTSSSSSSSSNSYNDDNNNNSGNRHRFLTRKTQPKNILISTRQGSS